MAKQVQGLSRRTFLTGTESVVAGIAATSLLGCSSGKTRETASSAASSTAGTEAASEARTDAIWAIKNLAEPKETVKADVCIVGAGGTGTAAAIQAIDSGLKPVVIERLNGYGGSFIGTEGMTCLETKYTEAGGGVYFAGAYSPDKPYNAENAANTCLNYHH